MNTATLKRKFNMKMHEVINDYDNETISKAEALDQMLFYAKGFRAMVRNLHEFDIITREEYIDLTDWAKETHIFYKGTL